MAHLPRVVFVVFLPLLLSVLSLSCSVFTSIGNGISSGYENTVTYFNVYYNASRLFNEAEAEIAAAEASTAGRSRGVIQAATAIPSTARQKLNAVIDKCSNILTFRATSSFVDDALLLIGKSYFLLGEYLKAERKFTELFGQFSESAASDEGQVWFLKTLDRLNKHDEAITAARALAEGAQEQGHTDRAGQAWFILGSVLAGRGEVGPALEAYDNAVRFLGDRDERAEAQVKIGDLLFAAREFSRSSEAYRRVLEITSDPFLQYYSTLHAARAERETGNTGASLVLTGELRDDYRFLEYSKEIRFDHALTLSRSGKIEEALGQFMEVDTTSRRTEIGSRAAFEVAKVYELHYRDFASALQAYGRAAQYPVPEHIALVRRKESALTQYFRFQEKLAQLDSLLNPAEPVAAISDSDSVSVNVRPLSRDSLFSEQRKIHYQMAELFYSELELPDSAIGRFLQTVEDDTDSSRIARSLYILAELSRSFPEKVGKESEYYYRRLVKDYPNFEYARYARERLGISVATPDDPAEELFLAAERSLDVGGYEAAIRSLRTIVNRHPQSPLAAKSAFAIGWIFENKIEQRDSALAVYRALVESHGGSRYAAAVKGRIGLETTPPQPPDSLTAPRPVQDSTGVGDTGGKVPPKEIPSLQRPAPSRRGQTPTPQSDRKKIE